jgi:hypothetical protein
MRAPAATVLVAAALVAQPALAQDRPPLFPTRDVAVTYRTLGEAAQLPAITMSWLAAQQLMRSDMPGMGYMIMDQRNQRAFMVVEQARMIMDIPTGQAMAQAGPSPNATFRREGSATVAGHACTIWSYQDGGNQGRACVTAEGVMLRAEGTSQGRTGGMEATQVAFGPQDPARFQRPQGYQAMQGMPGMPGAGQPQGGSRGR